MKKNIMKIVVLVGLAALTFGSVPAWADDDKPTASADISVLTRYVWRGLGLSEDSFVVQPSVSVSYKNFNFNLWGNLDTDQFDGDLTTEDDANFNETDMTLSYTIEYDKFTMELGYIYYSLDALADTQEFYYSVSYDFFLSPTITFYKDVDAVPGVYMNLGISYSLPLSGDMALDLGATIGYQASDHLYQYQDDLTMTNKTYNAIHDGTISASITIPIDDYISITPMLTYSFPLSDDAENYIKANSMLTDADLIYGGITCSISF